MYLSKFKADVVYKMSSRTVRAVTQRNPVSKNKKQAKNFNLYPRK